MKVVETGRNAILVCEAAGDPPPSVYWVKDTLRLEPDPRYSILDQGQLRGKIMNSSWISAHKACVAQMTHLHYRSLKNNFVFQCRIASN